MGHQEIFSTEEIIPVFLLASFSNISQTKNTCELSVRSFFASVDTSSRRLAEVLIRIFFNETYVFWDGDDRVEDGNVQLSKEASQKIMDYILKMESSAKLFPLNQKLVFVCLFKID